MLNKAVLACFLAMTALGCVDDNGETDANLRQALEEAGVEPLDPGNVLPMNDPKVVLGQTLFFDRALSGNEDISCATCHHPGFGSSDGLSLPVGVGGDGLGPGRELGEGRHFIPRNSPEIFNRGATAWTTMFWDNRVSGGVGNFYSPAGPELPWQLESVLAVQAMFPVTSAEEMRGSPGESEIAGLKTLPEVWGALTARLLYYDEYERLLDAAYPGTPIQDYRFFHMANAIAAFEVAAFTKKDTPFDAYVEGDDNALNSEQKRGAALFFGEANCSSCHNGPLLTDQQTHVLATPQLGPGKGEVKPLDIGRALETGADADMYAFRTPPLRNVELTSPYMHSGAYTTLREAIQHHLNPEATVMDYDVAQLSTSERSEPNR